LPPFDKPLPGFCSGNSQVVLFVELPFYNTVVLGAVIVISTFAAACAVVPLWAA